MHRRSHRFAFLVSLPFAAPLACSSSSGHVDTPKPAASASASVAAKPPPPDPCAVAANLRTKVKPFLDEGRLHRTVKLIEKADRLCPKSAPETWAPLATTLAELGKYAEARKVAAQIEADPKASNEAKAAASAAKEKCDKLDKEFPKEGFGKEMMKIEYLQAVLAEAKPDVESQKLAMEKYLASWDAWRPNGQALLGAGFVAKKLGQPAEAQRLFDRAIVDAEKAQNKEVVLDVPNGFSGNIYSVAWSKDGRRFAVAHEKEISIFDISWREKFRLRGHSSVVTSVAFSSDARVLASGSKDGTAKLWNVTTGDEIRTLQGHRGSIHAITYSPDGDVLVTGSLDTTIKLWDAASGNEIRTLEGHKAGITAVLYSPDGKILASGSSDKTVRLWDAATGKLLRSLEGHAGPIRSVAYSVNGKTIASGSGDHTVREWDVATGQLVDEMSGYDGEVSSVVYSPNGFLFASASLDSVHLWDANTKKNVGKLQENRDTITTLAYSPDGKTLASGVAHNLIVPKVRLWDMRTRTVARTLEEHSSYHSQIKYSPNGETLASGFADGTVRLWDVATGKFSHTFYGHAERVETIDYSPNGKTLVSGGRDKFVRLWDVDRGRALDKLEGHIGPVSSIVYAPDGKTLASFPQFPDYAVYLWDIAKGKLAFKLDGHTDSVYAVAYSPDSTTLASACRDQKVRIWSVAEGKLVHLLEGHKDVVVSVVYSPDGKTLASGSTDGIVRIWDAATGKHLRTFEMPKPAGDLNKWLPPIKSISFSADGKTLAARGDGKTVPSRLDDETAFWDVASGKLLRMLEGHANEVYWSGHSPNGSIVALESDDPSSIHFQRSDNDSMTAILRAIPTQDASYVYVPSGHIDFFGADACSARVEPLCRIGALTFPFDVCEERFYAPGILAAIHAGDSSYLEPENAPPLMKCPNASP